MNALMIIALAVGTTVYALSWHNQPAKPRREERSKPERELCRSGHPTRLLVPKTGPPKAHQQKMTENISTPVRSPL